MRDIGLGILVLAAGASSRMGKPKQLLQYQGKSLVRRAVETAMAVSGAEVVVVLGSSADDIRAELANTAADLIVNESWQSGIGSSIRCGMRALLERSPHLSAIVITLCDQPLISPAAIDRLIVAHRETGKSACAAAFADSSGTPTLAPPVLVGRRFFSQLLSLPNAQGAKHVWIEHPNEVCHVSCPEAALDVDTPEAFLQLSNDTTRTAV